MITSAPFVRVDKLPAGDELLPGVIYVVEDGLAYVCVKGSPGYWLVSFNPTDFVSFLSQPKPREGTVRPFNPDNDKDIDNIKDGSA